jgi:hypothetical protein
MDMFPLLCLISFLLLHSSSAHLSPFVAPFFYTRSFVIRGLMPIFLHCHHIITCFAAGSIALKYFHKYVPADPCSIDSTHMSEGESENLILTCTDGWLRLPFMRVAKICI